MARIALDEMSTAEKLQLMESLWDDLCRQPGGVASPDWHGQVLAEREAARASGAETPIDLDQVKRELLNRSK